MTDRELLEFAAKAAGFSIQDRSAPVTLYIHTDGCRTGYAWNPLSDDGDALRLAVKLRIEPHFTNDSVQAVTLEGSGFGEWEYALAEIAFDEIIDIYAATRRAIVRAAAEIGKKLTT